MRGLFFTFIGIIIFNNRAFAQNNVVIDTIPFNLEKRLLVFKGTINGVAIDFAFETGAA